MGILLNNLKTWLFYDIVFKLGINNHFLPSLKPNQPSMPESLMFVKRSHIFVLAHSKPKRDQ